MHAATKPQRLRTPALALVAALSAALCAAAAQAQTYGYVLNRSGNNFIFSCNGRPIRMADPTCIPLTIAGETWFFVTGTSDDHVIGNFPIFKSRDLRHWTFHGVAFDYGNSALNVAFPPTTPGYVVINNRRFESLWSPQLWVNPNGLDPNIHLTFTATEKTTSGTVRIQTSVMVSTMNLDDFKAGGSFFPDPMWYYYTADGGAHVSADGGVSRGTGWNIPSTIGPFYESPGGEPGTARHLLDGWEHIGREDQRTNMVDGSFVFFDPRAVSGQKAWLLYNTYQIRGRTGAGPFGLATTDYDGANSAAFPLWSTNLLNAHSNTPAQTPVELFHRFNMTPAVRPPAVCCGTTCTQQQNIGGIGLYDVPGGSLNHEPDDYCHPRWLLIFTPDNQHLYFPAWAEGPAAFFWNNNYYIFASRNMWWGPAYMMSYRVLPATGNLLFQDIGLSTPNNYNALESVLVAGNWFATSSGGRDPANTRSYGDGEVFEAFGRPYLVFHAKLEGTFERRIFFKELTLDTDQQHFLRLYDGHSNPAQDLNWFLARNDIQQCP